MSLEKERLRKIKATGRKTLTEIEAKEILREYGIDTTKGEIADSPVSAAQIAAKIGFPVVMKVVSGDIAHKSEAGGVKLGIKDPHEVEKAYQEIINNGLKKSTRCRN